LPFKTFKTEVNLPMMTLPPISNLDFVDTEGYAPFSWVVYWWASNRGEKPVTNADEVTWTTAQSRLIRLIQSGKVELIGKRNGSNTYETLPASELRNLSDIPVCDYFFGGSDDASGLICCYCPDDEDWKKGLNDRLFVPRWSRLQVRIEQAQRAQQDQEICTEVAQEMITARQSRRGATPRYDWPDVEQFVLKTLSELGDFCEWDIGNGWACQADLERAVLEYMEKHGGAPAESTVRSRVALMYQRWRDRQ
jgi:hypothetical protein